MLNRFGNCVAEKQNFSFQLTGLGLHTQKVYTHSGTSSSQIFCYLSEHIHKSHCFPLMQLQIWPVHLSIEASVAHHKVPEWLYVFWVCKPVNCLTVKIRNDILILLLSVFYSLGAVVLLLSTSHFLRSLLYTDNPVIKKLIKPDPVLVRKGIVALDCGIQFVVPSLQVIVDVNKTSCYTWSRNRSLHPDF